MKPHTYILYLLLFLSTIKLFAQNDTIQIKQQLQLTPIVYKPLSPARAAFYSAILPGAGQVYNNRYWWQLPAIYGGLGASTYFFIANDTEYKRFRTAFRKRKAGESDEFNGDNGRSALSISALVDAQKQLRKNRDMSLLSIVLVYILQVVEASVTAHLLQFDTSDNLSFQPTSITELGFKELPKVGFALKYSF